MTKQLKTFTVLLDVNFTYNIIFNIQCINLKCYTYFYDLHALLISFIVLYLLYYFSYNRLAYC
jgi:hypothetical protein